MWPGECPLGFSRECPLALAGGQGGPPRAEIQRMNRRQPGEGYHLVGGWGQLCREGVKCAGSGVGLDSDPGGITDQLCKCDKSLNFEP